MVRSYKELNILEKIGLKELLKVDGWRPCQLFNAKEGSRQAYSKKINGKSISVELEHFHVDEDLK